MKKNMLSVLGILLVTIFVALLAGCSTPKVVNFPDGSKTIKVNGRKCHIRTVEMDSGEYVLTLSGVHGCSIQPAEKAKPKDRD